MSIKSSEHWSLPFSLQTEQRSVPVLCDHAVRGALPQKPRRTQHTRPTRPSMYLHPGPCDTGRWLPLLLLGVSRIFPRPSRLINGPMPVTCLVTGTGAAARTLVVSRHTLVLALGQSVPKARCGHSSFESGEPVGTQGSSWSEQAPSL